MPIEELTSEDVLQRCTMCQSTARLKLATLSLGVGSTFADDVDGRIVRLPPCPICKAEEFLIRSTDVAPATPESYGDLHQLLVDQLHASVAKLGRFDVRLKLPALADLSPATVKEFFPGGFKLLAPTVEKVDPVP